MNALIADIVVLVHALFVLFVVAGQLLILLGWLLGWLWTRNPAFRIVHLVGIGFVVAEAWLGIVCPLTTLEMELRASAGQSIHEMSFVGYWLHRLLFYTAPEWVFTLSYTLFALVVAASFVFYPPRRSKRR